MFWSFELNVFQDLCSNKWGKNCVVSRYYLLSILTNTCFKNDIHIKNKTKIRFSCNRYLKMKKKTIRPLLIIKFPEIFLFWIRLPIQRSLLCTRLASIYYSIPTIYYYLSMMQICDWWFLEWHSGQNHYYVENNSFLNHRFIFNNRYRRTYRTRSDDTDMFPSVCVLNETDFNTNWESRRSCVV